MDGGHEFVGVGGEDGEGLERGSVLLVPALPEAGEGEWLARFERDAEGLLVFAGDALPLVEAVGGDEAASGLERGAKGGLGFNLFGACVDGVYADGRVPGPAWNEPPARGCEHTLMILLVQADDGLKRLRCDVVVDE